MNIEAWKEMKERFIVKVKSNGILIPKDKLKGINEGDLVQIKITKLYMSKRTKRSFIQILNL